MVLVKSSFWLVPSSFLAIEFTLYLHVSWNSIAGESLTSSSSESTNINSSYTCSFGMIKKGILHFVYLFPWLPADKKWSRATKNEASKISTNIYGMKHQHCNIRDVVLSANTNGRMVRVFIGILHHRTTIGQNGKQNETNDVYLINTYSCWLGQPKN